MILITGITGRSGKWLLANFAKDRIFCEVNGVCAYIRDIEKFDELNGNNVPIEKIVGDINNSDQLNKAMMKADTVLHISGIHTSLKVVDAAIDQNVEWLILVHTTGIYSKFKAAGEEYIKIENEIRGKISNSKTRLTILRPTMIYGNISDQNISIFIKMVDKFKLFPIVAGARFPLQPVNQKDLGDAYFLVLKNKEQTINKEYILSGKESIFLIDIFKAIGKIINRSPVFISVPFVVAYAGAWLLYLLTLGKNDMREKVQRLVEPRVFSHDLASTDFGYSPMAFEEGLRTECEEYLSQKFRK